MRCHITFSVLAVLAINRSPVAAEIPRLLSPYDHQSYRAAFIAADKGRHDLAMSLAVKCENPLPAKILVWLDMTRQGTHASFAELSMFIKANPNWPLRGSMFRRAEETLDDEEPSDRIIAWFSKYPPKTSEGLAKMGAALLLAGHQDQGLAKLRKAWIEGSYGAKQDRIFARRFRKMLNQEDHRARLNRLLWDGMFTQARRMLWRVDNASRSLAEARMRLSAMQGGVDRAIARVPNRLKNHSGLVFERLRWRRRKGRTEGALELLKTSPARLVRPIRWWLEREILGRRLLTQGQAERAYRLIHEHGLREGSNFADAEFLSGWIALRFLHEPARALYHFERLHSAVRYPISRSRAAYWAGRAADRLDDEDGARDWFERAAEFDSSYYGQLAAEHLGIPMSKTMSVEPQPGGFEIVSFNRNELVRAVFLLNELGQHNLIKPFIDRLVRLGGGPVQLMLVGRLALAVDRIDLATRVGRYAYLRGVQLPSLAYPVIEVPGEVLEPALVLSIARQESNFFVLARSSQGARGIMQVMPRTARSVSRQLKLAYSKSRLQQDPIYNMRLGSAYLKSQLDRFNGSYVLAIAAYNAGPAAVDRWISFYGDPRSDDLNSIDWIELIPYRETRNYVQRVVENLKVYRRLNGENKPAYSLRPK